MQCIIITLNSYDIDFQSYVNDLSYVEVGETIQITTFDNVTKLITKN